jgi:hypothetical protein
VSWQSYYGAELRRVRRQQQFPGVLCPWKIRALDVLPREQFDALALPPVTHLLPSLDDTDEIESGAASAH